MSNSLWPNELYSPRNSPGQNTRVDTFPFSRGSSQSRDWTQVFCIAGGFFHSCATRQDHVLTVFLLNALCSMKPSYQIANVSLLNYYPSLKFLLEHYKFKPMVNSRFIFKSNQEELRKCSHNLDTSWTTWCKRLGTNTLKYILHKHIHTWWAHIWLTKLHPSSCQTPKSF